MFDTAEDASQKLAQTVIFYRDRPVFIHSIKNSPKGILITATDLPLKPSGDPYDLRIEITDKDLDWTRLGERLGYLNVDWLNQYKQAVYVCRYPVRKSIQGLSKQNTVIPHLQAPLNNSNASGKSFYYENMLTLPGFVQMLSNTYPSYTEIQDKFSRHPEAHSYAFHRWFAVTRKQVGPMFLAYKGQDIGWSEDMTRFILDKKYRHLSETLEDQGIDFK